MSELVTKSQSLACTPEQFTQMEAFAERIAKSGLFGISNSSAIVTLMLLCQAEGINPLLALRRYHIIEGKPAMRADAMQGEFEREGVIMWHDRTDLEAGATFFRYAKQCDEAGEKRAIERYKLKRMQLIDPPTTPADKKALSDKIANLSKRHEDTVVWTAEDAWTKGISLSKGVDKQGNPVMKHNWATYPRQMLSARVVTEGVRLVWPGLIAGIASVEELQDLPAEEPKSSSPNYLGMTLDQLREAEQREASAYAQGDKSAMERLNSIRDRMTEIDEPVTHSFRRETRADESGKTVIVPVASSIEATFVKDAVEKVDSEIMAQGWKSLKCHAGAAKGPLLGRTLGELFVQSKLGRSEKMMELLCNTRVVTNPTTPEDRSLIAAIGHAKAFLEERKTKEGGDQSKPAHATQSSQEQQTAVVQSTEGKVDSATQGMNDAAAKSHPSPAAIDWRHSPIYLPQSKVHGKPLGMLKPEHLLNLEQMMITHYTENAGDEHTKFSRAVEAAKADIGFGCPHSVLMRMITDRVPCNDASGFVSALNKIAGQYELPEVAINPKTPLTNYSDDQLRRILWLIPKLIPE